MTTFIDTTNSERIKLDDFSGKMAEIVKRVLLGPAMMIHGAPQHIIVSLQIARFFVHCAVLLCTRQNGPFNGIV